MMMHTSSKITIEVSGRIRNSTRYAIEDKLMEIAPKLDEKGNCKRKTLYAHS